MFVEEQGREMVLDSSDRRGFLRHDICFMWRSQIKSGDILTYRIMLHIIYLLHIINLHINV